jgi:hypothetical protein
MNIRIRAVAATIAMAAVLSLTAACGSDTSQGTAKRASQTPADNKADETTEEPAEEPVADDQPETELAVGDTFRYNDGVEFTVTSIKPITEFGAYDDKPSAKDTAFRVTWTVANGTSKPLDLDSWSINPQGATTGGEVTFFYTEKGSKQMTGRLAPSRTGTYTGEYSLPKEDGNDVVVTAARMDDAFLNSDDAALLGEDPHWTGAIK